MKMIRPVSDLRNNFADISKTVHETAKPVFLTKNGYGDMVVLSMEAFECFPFAEGESSLIPLAVLKHQFLKITVFFPCQF